MRTIGAILILATLSLTFVELITCVQAEDSNGGINSVSENVQVLQRENESLKNLDASRNKELAHLKEKLEQAEAKVESLVRQKEVLEEQIQTLESKERENKERISQLEKENKELVKELSCARDSHGDEAKELKGKISRYKTKYEHYKNAYITVSIILYSLVSAEVLLLVSFFVILLIKRHRQPRQQNAISAPTAVPAPAVDDNKTSKTTVPAVDKKNNNELRCPLCGWKYNPGEKVCKNCRTQF